MQSTVRIWESGLPADMAASRWLQWVGELNLNASRLAPGLGQAYLVGPATDGWGRLSNRGHGTGTPTASGLLTMVETQRDLLWNTIVATLAATVAVGAASCLGDRHAILAILAVVVSALSISFAVGVLALATAWQPGGIIGVAEAVTIPVAVGATAPAITHAVGAWTQAAAVARPATAYSEAARPPPAPRRATGIVHFLDRLTAGRRRQYRIAVEKVWSPFGAVFLGLCSSMLLALCWAPPLARAGQVLMATIVATAIVTGFFCVPILGERIE
jgi:hypothetical protein